MVAKQILVSFFQEGQQGLEVWKQLSQVALRILQVLRVVLLLLLIGQLDDLSVQEDKEVP